MVQQCLHFQSQMAETWDKEKTLNRTNTIFVPLAAAYQMPEEDWAVRLVPVLTGKAYVPIAAVDTHDCWKVNEAILAKHEIEYID